MKKLKREWRTVEWLLFPENIIINLYWPNQVMIAVFTENEPFGLIISSHYLYEALMGIFKSLRWLSPETSS
jgi:hypothetical protein